MARLQAGLALGAVVAVALAAPAAGSQAAAAAPLQRVVLSVSDDFAPSSLPTGSRLEARYDNVGALVVSVPADAAAGLARLPGVRSTAPDYGLSVSSTTSSTGAGVLAPQGLGGGAGTSTAGTGVTVAVLDTGVADSESLNRGSGRLLSGPDTSGESSAARDGHGHGTFMANIVAGGSVAGQQVGVAPAARVVDVKVATADGSTSLSKVLAGLDWVAQNRASYGIRVLSLSLAAQRPQQAYLRDPLTDAAEAVRSAGVLVAVSAGNLAGELGDPGHDPLLMTVGAADTRSSAATAGFSGSGRVAGMPRPDVVAAGVSVLSVLPPESAIATANPSAATGTGLHRGSGTSQATAVAAGAAATFLAGRSDLTPDDVRASFASVARDLAGSADGAGLIKIPTKVVRWSAEAAGTDSGTSATPTTSSTTWSANSWSSTTWSSSTWSANSWSANSWSANSWSSTTWSSTTWSSTTWSASW